MRQGLEFLNTCLQKKKKKNDRLFVEKRLDFWQTEWFAQTESMQGGCDLESVDDSDKGGAATESVMADQRPTS